MRNLKERHRRKDSVQVLPKNDERIYIALVDTTGIFASLLHIYLSQKYIHVVLSMDECFDEAYSFGRRNPSIPFFSGFERERKEEILKAFPEASYQIFEIACSKEQKQAIFKTLKRDYKRRKHLHYAVIGLPLIAIHRPFRMKSRFTCSAYIAKLLIDSDVLRFEKHYSIVTPRDFAERLGDNSIYEGKLSDFIRQTAEIQG